MSAMQYELYAGKDVAEKVITTEDGTAHHFKGDAAKSITTDDADLQYAIAQDSDYRAGKTVKPQAPSGGES